MQNHLYLKALLVVALGFFGTILSVADTITLKSGKVIEGKVLEDNNGEYLIEVQVTRSIKDRKTFKKSEILSIEKTAEDAQPFEDLQGILPSGDQMAAGDYQLLIEGKVKDFITKFPKSEHLPKVKKMLATLEGELKRVEAGDIKLEGKWISAAEWNANAFDLDSLVIYHKMEKTAKAGAYRSALLTYDALKVGYSSSGGLDKARTLASKILPAYQTIIRAKAEKAKQLLADREHSIDNLPIRDRTRAKAGFEAEKAKYASLLAEAKENKVRWIPSYDYDERALRTLERTIKSEITSLSRVREDRNNLAELYRETWAAAGKGDTNTVERALSKFRSKGIDPKYAELLRNHLAANPAPEPVVEEKPKPEPKPEPKVEEKPKPKKKPQRSEEIDLSEPEEEKGSSMMTIVYVLLGLALIGILVGVLLKSRKSEEEE